MVTMGLSRLCKQCRECRYVETCDHKRMEALAYCEPMLSPATTTAAATLTQPLLVSHDYRNIKVGENTTITIDLEEVKEQLRKSYYPNFLQFGG